MRNRSSSPPIHVHVNDTTPVHVHVKSQRMSPARTPQVRDWLCLSHKTCHLFLLFSIILNCTYEHFEDMYLLDHIIFFLSEIRKSCETHSCS